MSREIEQKWGHLPYFRKIGSEWYAACPRCGDTGHDWSNPRDLPNRFHMHSQDHLGPARGKCRQCGYFEWARDIDRGPLTVDEIRQREQASIEAKKQERKEYEEKLAQFRREKPWKVHHEALTPRGRRMWRGEGVPDSLQDRLMLGEGEKEFYDKEGNLLTGHALTIPHFETGWKPMQVQYRLTRPPKGCGKYRWWGSGLGASVYLADPDEGVTGDVLLCEGAKKAIVSYLELVLKGDQRNLTVVAVASKTPSQRNLNRLRDASLVYVCFDPDAFDVDVGDETAIERVTRMLGPARVRVVSLPDKIDDLINSGATWQDIMPFLKRARKP